MPDKEFLNIAVLVSDARLHRYLASCLQNISTMGLLHILPVSNIPMALSLFAETEIDLLILDSALFDEALEPLCEVLRANDTYIPTIWINGGERPHLTDENLRSMGITLFEIILLSSVTDTILGASIEHLLQRKQMFLELRELQGYFQKAQLANQLLLSYIGHELYSPIESAILIQESVQERSTDPDIALSAKTTIMALRHVNNTVRNLIDHVKVKNGVLCADNEVFNVCNLLQEIQQLFKPQADIKNIQLEIICLDCQHENIFADKQRLRQILINFVKNAIQFTDGGIVSIGCQIQLEKVCFEVKDSGQGISRDRLREIRQYLDAAEAIPSQTGLGIGLQLSSELITLLEGGEMNILSEVGVGSVFSFKINKLDLPFTDETGCKVVAQK